MEPIKTIRSRTAVLPFENIDTDQIIPARFLRATTREGFGKNLFADWRYDAERRAAPGLPAEPAAGAGLHRFSSPAATSAAAPRASMRRGRSRTMAFAPSSAPSSRISSAPTR